MPVFVEVHQTEVAAADGAIRRGASRVIMRVVPENLGSVGLGAGLQERSQADAVDERLERLDAGEFEDGRVDIDRHRRGVLDQASLGRAGGVDDEGDADAAFVGRALADAEGRVVGGHVITHDQAAVIGGEDDDRILIELKTLQRSADRAERVIDALDERGVGGVLLLEVRELRGLSLVLGDDVRLAAERRMHGVVRQVEEERLLLIRLDELHRLGGLAVGEEFAFGAFGQRGDLVRGVVTGRLSAGVAADVEVEAVLLGIVSLVALLECRSEVPLADARGRVAGGFELFGQGDLLEGQELLPIGDLQFGLGAAVAGDPVGKMQAGGVFAGKQGGPGGGADRAG